MNLTSLLPSAVSILRFSAVVLLTLFFGAVSHGEDAGSCGEDAGLSRPNIVLIYADDLGYADLSCYGNQYHETPSVDRLMRSGMRFTQAYANAPLCTPSRIALLTGRHCARAGCYDVFPQRILVGVDQEAVGLIPPLNNPSLPEDHQIISEYLREIGYRTGCFGKWHVGRVPANKRGFDKFVSLRTTSHFDSRKGLLGRSEDYPEPAGYSSDYLTRCAVQFIRESRDVPFFLYLPHTLVHTAKGNGKGVLQPKPELLKKYQSKSGSELHQNPAYAAMVEALDQAVGTTVEALRKHGCLENTVIIFTSDNGGVMGRKRGTQSGLIAGSVTTNYPLRDGKLRLFEGGIRVPTSITDGRRARQGAVCDAVISQLDLLPTILEMAKHPRSKEIMQSLDGVSLAPLLDNPKSDWPSRELCWHFPGYRISNAESMTGQPPASAIRWGNWKMIEYLETGRVELFDLKSDVGESTDLSDIHPELVDQLRHRLERWRRATNAPMPVRKNAGSIGSTTLRDSTPEIKNP